MKNSDWPDWLVLGAAMLVTMAFVIVSVLYFGRVI